MLSSLKPLLYVQITPTLVLIKNLKTGATSTHAAEVALSGSRRASVLGFGNQAGAAMLGISQARLVKPFAHPRSLVSDFASAEALLKRLVTETVGKSFWTIAPKIVIHPMGSPEGGFTQVERRAFRELALGSGASEVEVWTGRELTDTEIKSKATPPEAGDWGG